MARYHNVDFANDNSSGGSGGDYYSSSYGSSYGSNYGSNYSSGLGPSLADGMGSGVAIKNWGPQNVAWIQPAVEQSRLCTSIYTKCQDLRDIINKLQEDYDIIQSYGSAFVKDTSLAEAISVLDVIKNRIQNLGNVRLDSAVSQYNNNIEFYRVEYYRDLINQEAQNYNYEASSNIQYYRENWEMTHDLEEGEDYWSYQERADDAAATYKSYNYPDYEISLCNHGETTLSALARCSTYGILKRNGTWTTFETRPSDT